MVQSRNYIGLLVFITYYRNMLIPKSYQVDSVKILKLNE